MNNLTLPDIGQIISIAAQVIMACYILQQLNKMPHGFYYIIVNRIRYIQYIGFRNWVKQFLPYQKAELEYSPYNESYLWLKSSPVYYGYAFMLITSMALIVGLVHQFGLGQVYTKPKEFFIASPLRQYSIYLVISCLVAENISLKKENSLLRVLHYKMKDQIAHLKQFING